MMILRHFYKLDQFSAKLHQRLVGSDIFRGTGYDQLIHIELISGDIKQYQAGMIGIIVASEAADDVVADMSIIIFP